jgi:hypothetical protein
MSESAHSFSEQAPPEGISVSEQTLENRIWRIQLDLATGGVRSLLVRWNKVRHELAAPDGPIHPFQLVGLGRDGEASSRFLSARARFDIQGATLAVESELSGHIVRTVFQVQGVCPCLSVSIGPGDAGPVGVALPFPALPFPETGWVAGGEDWMRREFAGFQLVMAGRGILCRPEVQRVDLTGAGPVRLLFQAASSGESAGRQVRDELLARHTPD